MEGEKKYRSLHLAPKRPRPLVSVFWWLAGIALCVFFLACVALAYYAHRVHA